MVSIVCGDIIDAALQGNVHLLEALLSTSMVDVDDLSDDDSTPLIVAAQEGHLRVVRALLHAGARVNHSNDAGWTSLMASCSRGHLAVAKTLVGAGAEIDASDEDGISPLRTAAGGGHTTVVEYLIGVGAKVQCPDNDGLSPLHAAAMYGHLSTAKMLAGAGAEMDAADSRGDSALIHASNNGHVSVVKCLAAAGADLERPDNDGQGPLHRAAAAGRVAVVAALLAAGADRDSGTHVKETPLLLAALNGRLDVVRVLLRAGANPAQPMILPTGNVFVALDAAAQQGHARIARELRALGVDAGGGPRRGVVGLCLAAQREDLEMLATLTDGGVIDTGKALCDSCNQGREVSVRCLLRQDWGGTPRSTYVNWRNDLGFTPLWLAAATASPRIARWLLDAGADESATCKNTNLFQFEGAVVTPLGFVVDSIRQMNYRGRSATGEQVERMRAVRRLLERVDAVRATSWLWCSGENSTVSCAGEEEMGGDAGMGGGASDADDAGAGSSKSALNVAIFRSRRRGAATRAFFRYARMYVLLGRFFLWVPAPH